MRRNIITAKVGYTVKTNYHDTRTGEKVRVLFDGDEMIMVGHIKTMQDHCEELEQNEEYHVCEVFTTVKGNQFIYARDEELDKDYLIMVENDNL